MHSTVNRQWKVPWLMIETTPNFTSEVPSIGSNCLQMPKFDPIMQYCLLTAVLRCRVHVKKIHIVRILCLNTTFNPEPVYSCVKLD